ncbi:TrmH family RNA methyltransferase [Bordetella holmesii]|uniref:RNA methyltransferase, TrmH family n=2 Tax=Bordetella holmesii TaxID=35814 RepID=A0A158M135_9BORD|nr:RNA methyltransferase [Bordetella holmesii]AHV93829.1 spoU rRNA Methylase family protein [Bordetella holmesii ATCC 51541]AIT28094.1 spoU rRNA Methylase family protein [Bordetella holmesii 44057]EWM40877.1 spoU rRNA Methylase family protein [Bordetella holmesii 35009]EWM42999.1 spoU rRNA Methylase family protein [Bordetella holmesii 41130]EWM44770.1 spoU rRNA Methylase family protein [Bordetella holmesii 70147]
MKLITSRENPAVKALHRLAEQAGRRGAPVLLEGVHLCQAWLARHGAPQQAVFDAERLDQPELADLARRVPQDVSLALDSRLMRGLGSVEGDQGVAFVVRAPDVALPETIRANCVWLDRIQDPGNVGTLLRTCAAAGIRQAFLATGSAAAWSPKVLRSGQGAHFALEIHEHVDLHALSSRLRIPMAVTTLEQSQDLFATALPSALAWVFGHEGQGVDAALQARAELRLRIAHDTHAVESLNVGAAAAICLFEQRRQGNFA